MRTTLATLTILAIPGLAAACGYGMPSPAARLASADCVLVGKVVTFEDRTLHLKLNPNQPAYPMTVASLKVKTMIKGDERLTHVRVALYQQQVMQFGYTGCFFLTAHPQEPVYLLSSDLYDYAIGQEGNAGFDKQVEEFKRLGQLLRNPIAGLQSKNADDRFLTAALLISEFRTPRMSFTGQQPKAEPIDRELNRLVLKALAESDWKKAAADFRLTPVRLFRMLDIKPADGFDFAKYPNTDQLYDAARAWLKDDTNRFQIKAFVRS